MEFRGTVLSLCLFLAPLPAGAAHVVQVGAFRNAGGASSVAQELRGEGYTVQVVNDDLYRVFIGPFAERSEAADTLARLTADGREGFLRSDVDRGGDSVVSVPAGEAAVAPPEQSTDSVQNSSLVDPTEAVETVTTPVPESAQAAEPPTAPARDEESSTQVLVYGPVNDPEATLPEIVVVPEPQGSLEEAESAEPGEQTLAEARPREAADEEPVASAASLPPTRDVPPFLRDPGDQKESEEASLPEQPEPLILQPVEPPPDEQPATRPSREREVAKAGPPEPPRPFDPAPPRGPVVIRRESGRDWLDGPVFGTVDLSAVAGALVTHGQHQAFGAGAGVFLKPWLLPLAEFTYIPLGGLSAETQQGNVEAGGRLLDFGVGAQVHFPVAWSRIAPYSGGGIGWRRGSYEATVLDTTTRVTATEFRYHVGGGARIYLSERWGLRPDVKVYIGGGDADIQVAAGLFFQMW